MTTRRERLQAKLQKRQEWAESRDAKSEAGFARAKSIADNIPLGQPILVGHHSERHHRRDIARIDSGMRAGVESAKMAEHHRGKAHGIERQLDSSIFSDDHDAVAQLEARIAEREAERSRMREVNRLYRKKDAQGLAALGLSLEKLQATVARLEIYGLPYASFELSNLGARITADKKRLEQVKARQARAEKANAAPHGVLVEGTDYVRVTFAEKPERTILDDLRAASFNWSSGSWYGHRAKLPESVLSLISPDTTGSHA